MSGTTLKKDEFIRSLGFEDDPFRYYNADQEERLDKYFIDPPIRDRFTSYVIKTQ
ncbi:MAG: hypothetical protein K6T83_10855 [Alicyclobacillus sp.]|nr:hypothetical protein [Alicyclobacillus sp.]